MAKQITNILSCLTLSLLVVSHNSQKVWEKKPYAEWNLAEVLRMLTDSPWAQTAFETTRFSYNVPGQSYSATIRLRSALPVRQALVRQRQLAVNYDKFNAADRARFDAETSEVLKCADCMKYYIVTLASLLSAGSPPVTLSDNVTLTGNLGIDIGVALERKSLNDLKAYVHLRNDKGQRREMVGFIAPVGRGKEAMFVFRRFDEHGRPLITTDNKKFYFEIDKEVFRELGGPLKRFTFEVSKLVQNGEVNF